jgi:EAL domain-containing protein (putative c-di-GMP-specific phosphodiesterase class I)
MTSFEQCPPGERHEDIPDLPTEERVFMVPTCESVFETVLQGKVGSRGTEGYEILARKFGTGEVPRKEIDSLRLHGDLLGLTTHMLMEADRQSLLVGKPIAVNVSPTELTTELVEYLRALQADNSGVTERVQIEITEESPLGDMHVNVLREIADLGYRLAMDDFGSGFATMETLNFLLEHEIPIYTVKVDKTLVDEGRAGEVARALLGRVPQIVVEGVETKEQLDGLPEGVLVQGFIYGRPRSVTNVLLDRAA